MNFEIGKFYKHKRMKDVAFCVLEQIETTPLKLNISWYNTHYDYPMDLCEVVTIKDPENYEKLDVK